MTYLKNVYILCVQVPIIPHIKPLQTLMRSLTPAQCNRVLELLDKGESSHSISSITGISVGSISNIRSKHHSTLSKSVGGCPQKLSPSDIQYAIHLITSQKAENATEVTRTLQDMTNTQHTLYCKDSTKSTQGHRHEGCNQAKTTFSLCKA